MNQGENPSKSLIQSCLRYAALRVHSKREFVDYLEGKTNNSEIINQVIEYLEVNHLIDDREFAVLWTESRLRRGKGDLLIKAELHQKGISKEIVNDVIASISARVWIDAVTVAATKYQSKWLSLTGYEQKAKLFQILRMRGFSGRHIDAFVRSRVE